MSITIYYIQGRFILTPINNAGDYNMEIDQNNLTSRTYWTYNRNSYKNYQNYKIKIMHQNCA